MNISSVTSAQSVQSPVTSQGPDSEPPGASATSAGPATVTSVSAQGHLMQQLQALHDSDPAKFKQVVSAMAASLRNDAQGATGQTADRLSQIASRLDQVAESGDLSQLAPQHSGSAPGSGKAHHGHHGGGGSVVGTDLQKALTDALASVDQSTTSGASSA